MQVNGRNKYGPGKGEQQLLLINSLFLSIVDVNGKTS